MNARWKRLPTLAASAITALLLVGATAGPAQAQTTSPGADQQIVGCGVTYTIAAQWLDGFTANVTVTNTGTVPITWSVTIVFSDGSQATQGWNGVFRWDDDTVIIHPPAWAPALAPGGSHTAGLVGTGRGVPQHVGVTCTAAW